LPISEVEVFWSNDVDPIRTKRKMKPLGTHCPISDAREQIIGMDSSGCPPMPFTRHRDSFDPETLAILEAAFSEAWEVVEGSGGAFDQKSHEECYRRSGHQIRG
jgi:hypothetical protein